MRFRRAAKTTVLVVAVAVGSLLVALIGVGVVVSGVLDVEQVVLEPFYTAPSPLPDVPAGTLLRYEQVGDVPLSNATVYRVLYMTELADGSPAVSGGLVFVPTVAAPNPDGTRPVVAWAHGTVGQGDACAPSRGDVLVNTRGWLELMMSRGWLVTATDYAGLGTSGGSNYLVGTSEVNDVVNSVRAAKTIPGAMPGRDWVVWGHSQGGHAALWVGAVGPRVAPELRLLGVAAAAPAAELPEIVDAQWDSTVGWLIGPEAVQSWKRVYPELGGVLGSTVSPVGLGSVDGVAEDCLVEGALVGEGRELAGERFFTVNPVSDPTWLSVMRAETPLPLPSDLPVFIAQGTADETVLPGPQALLQERWCAAGSNISMLWMNDVLHVTAAMEAGPSAVAWMADRFADRPAPPRSCDTPPPVTPSTPVPAGVG